jgi:hypothetical protein
LSRPPCAHFSLSSEESRDNKDFSFSRASTHVFRGVCMGKLAGLCVAHVASFFSKLKYTSQGVRLSCAPEIPTLQGLITLHPRAANQLEMRSRLLQRRSQLLSECGEAFKQNAPILHVSLFCSTLGDRGTFKLDLPLLLVKPQRSRDKGIFRSLALCLCVCAIRISFFSRAHTCVRVAIKRILIGFIFAERA